MEHAGFFMPMSETLKKLHDIYGDNPVKRDIWGRRPATATELEQAMQRREEFEDLIDEYWGTPEMEEKINGQLQELRRKGARI